MRPSARSDESVRERPLDMAIRKRFHDAPGRQAPAYSIFEITRSTPELLARPLTVAVDARAHGRLPPGAMLSDDRLAAMTKMVSTPRSCAHRVRLRTVPHGLRSRWGEAQHHCTQTVRM